MRVEAVVNTATSFDYIVRTATLYEAQRSENTY